MTRTMKRRCWRTSNWKKTFDYDNIDVLYVSCNIDDDDNDYNNHNDNDDNKDDNDYDNGNH